MLRPGLLFLGLLNFCLLSSFCPAESLFTLHGSNTVGAKLAPELVKAYLQHRGASYTHTLAGSRANELQIQGELNQVPVTVAIAAHGSSTGFRGLAGDNLVKVDIAMSSRTIKPKELKKLSLLGDLKSLSAEHIIAIDGLAILVHPHNPINQLSVEQIAKLFSGQISSWRQLGGHDGPVNIYARDNNSGTWDTFKNLVLAKKYKLSRSAQRFESNDDLSDSVAADTNGIGFVGLASVRQAKLLAVSDNNTPALMPNRLSVASEDYPLARRLYLYTGAGPKPASIQNFLDFCQSQRGQAVVEQVGFVSQYPLAIGNSPYRQGPETYLQLTSAAQRLSINFRFKANSAHLDNKARRDLLRLSQYLKRPENESKRLLLIGFGDIKQSRSRAVVLSKLRATVVKSALREQGIGSQPVLGFGAFKPVANNAGNNRIKNRRVEIWLI